VSAVRNGPRRSVELEFEIPGPGAKHERSLRYGNLARNLLTLGRRQIGRAIKHNSRRVSAGLTVHECVDHFYCNVLHGILL
jgi:hypothetical protein